VFISISWCYWRKMSNSRPAGWETMHCSLLCILGPPSLSLCLCLAGHAPGRSPAGPPWGFLCARRDREWFSLTVYCVEAFQQCSMSLLFNDARPRPMLVCYVSRVGKLLDKAFSRSGSHHPFGSAVHNRASQTTEKETRKQQVTEDEGGRDGVGCR
jgi:hypothetical protein